MQTLSPYSELQQQGAHPTSTILLKKSSLPIVSFLPLLKQQHFVAAAVVLTAFLSEFLVIALSGLPYRPGQLPDEFYFCGVSAVILLTLMTIVLVVVNFWRRALPDMPRNPDNVAAVIMHVHQSRMCNDFEGTEHLSTRKRDERIRKLKKLYYYGPEEDGAEARRIIDEVPDQVQFTKLEQR